MGEEFKTKGFYGKKVTTNSSFSFFAQFYRHFAKSRSMRNKYQAIQLYRGGIYLEGFDHISLKSLLKMRLNDTEQE